MSTLTSAPHFLAFLISLWILSLAADHHEVIVKDGEDVTLHCQAPRDAQINMFEWIRPDLESDGYIFRFIPEESTTVNQHSSYRGRVELRDPDMKDGDLSVVLKDVSVSDTGTYRCRVGISGGGKPKVYSTIQLIVSDPGSEDGNSSPVGLLVGLAAVGLVLGAVAVAGFLKYKRCKNKRSGPSAADDDKASAVQFI
ncbi:programmed cell death 1 ligand 1-like [Sander lucioperca]|uniref:programmed cell death 1 ligand 1-like n=1 Tax=Sander lucioperca TaxID=283035 RepID=UPI001653849D|nr:programmed cell death 1 ligand 1-like [Sander lucioperca]